MTRFSLIARTLLIIPAFLMIGWFLFDIVSSVWFDQQNAFDRYEQKLVDREYLSDEQYCRKYYSDYVVANLPVRCLSVFK